MTNTMLAALVLGVGALAMPLATTPANAHGRGGHGHHGHHHGHHHHGHHHHGGFYGRGYGFYIGPGYGYGPSYGYGYRRGGCGWLLRRAELTGKRYWWRRYSACVEGW